MCPGDSALGIFRCTDPDMHPGTQDSASPRTLVCGKAFQPYIILVNKMHRVILQQKSMFDSDVADASLKF